jgi:hypothetical protein
MDASFLSQFIHYNDFFLRTFPLSSSKINLCSKCCLGVIGWVPMSLIDSQHDELCVHKKRKKNEQNSKTGISTTTAKLKKTRVGWSSMMLETWRSNNNDKRSCFAKGVAFRLEMARLEAIFRYFKKTSHNFFKNQTYQVGLPPPKSMKYKVFRHEKM